ncbi:hypothetical protein BG005_010541 [Podila minutissima]|nr:hypothetical protein BG005_010541 [Podila minutissima]
MSTPEQPSAPADSTTNSSNRKPKVIIAGGGLGGLTLAILLHKANIDFEVLERAKEVKPLGSAVGLGIGVAALFKQMDLYDDFVQIGKQHTRLQIFNETLAPEFAMEYAFLEGMTNCKEYLVSRADLYDVLWRHCPRDQIHLSKKITDYDQDDEGVTVRCADGSTYRGDILVGADGAYSVVRTQLYEKLKEQNKLPASDAEPLPFSNVCLVGQTRVLDPEEFPSLKSKESQFLSVLGIENMYTWTTLTTKSDTICWAVVAYLEKESSKADESFCNSEWGPEAAESMCQEVRDFKVPGGKDGKVLTMGDIIDLTPKDLISKVMLEEKVFDTWYSGRTVLIGDACHKMNPSGGVGALNAMFDAVTIANWISTLESSSVSDLDVIFKEYHAERYPVAQAAYARSKMFAYNLGKSWISVFVRAVMRRLPEFLMKRLAITQLAAVRPQVSFLPLVEDKASIPKSDQPSLHKTLAIHKARAAKPSQSNDVAV